jgi:phi13 family phage major tail protein
MSNFISVDKLYYAIELLDPTGGVATYSVPKPIGKSVKISVEPTIATGEFYADGGLSEYATLFVSAKVALETEVLALSVVADLLGHVLDGAGGIVFGKNDHAPNACIMYRRAKGNGNYRYIKVFKCKFADGKEDGETVTNSLKFQDDTLDGVAFARYSDGNWKAIKDEDETGYTDVSASWFESVDGVSVPLTIASITPAKATTAVVGTTPIKIVFSTSLNPSTVNGSNISLIKELDASVVPATMLYNDTNKTVTITPTTTLTTGQYTVSVDTDVKDTAGNCVANEYTSYFTVA